MAKTKKEEEEKSTEDKNSKIALMIYGDAGSGKSVIAATFPNSLYFDFDASCTRIRKLFPKNKYITPLDGHTSKKMVGLLKSALFQIKKGNFQYQTIVIDSISSLEETVVRGFQGTDDVMGKDLYEIRKNLNFDKWGAISNSTLDLVKNLRTYGINVVVTAEVQLKQLQDDEGERKYPAVTGKSATKLVHKFDYVGFLESRNEKEGTVRYLTFKNNDQFQAKGRFDGEVPDPIKNPNYDKIIDLVDNYEGNLNFSD